MWNNNCGNNWCWIVLLIILFGNCGGNGLFGGNGCGCGNGLAATGNCGCGCDNGCGCGC